jgi:hypothetical protein
LNASVPVYELTCLWCVMTFFICRPDYRGQEYCGDDCRKHGYAANHRVASARHERSLGDEGKHDRRERRRDRAAKDAEVVASASYAVSSSTACGPTRGALC